MAKRFYAEEFLIEESYTDGGNDLGVDAVYISRSNENVKIHVIQSKNYTSSKKQLNAFKSSALLRLREFFSVVKSRHSNLDKISNPKLRQKILEIRELQEREFPSFVVWLVSNGAPCPAPEIEKYRREFEKFDAEIEEFHLAQFNDFCLAGKSKRTDHSFYARTDSVIEYGASGARGVIGVISARELFNLMKDITDESKIDYGLFDTRSC